MSKNNQLSINLTLEEVNTILTALGERPYVQVFELVQKIQQQAQMQVQQGEKGSDGKVEGET